MCTPGTPKGEICENGIDEDCNGSDLPCPCTLHIDIVGPANLSSTNQPLIPVNGTVDPTATAVTCNGWTMGINKTNNTFGGNVPLKEGSNIVTCVATDEAGHACSDSITVALDSTPPRVTIDTPQDGATAVTSPITVTGLVNDLVMGTVNGDEAGVRCNGIEATVANRRFVAENVPLTAGANTITCIGEDKVGNIDTARISVTLDTTAQKKITVVSGNNQTGDIGALLPQPLVAALTDNGAPVAGQVVVFKVLQNDGVLSTDTTNGRILAANTDANGHAQVDFTLGSWAGAGNNQVEDMATGFVGEVRFSASALPAVPNSIVVDAGNMQFGVVSQLLPKPLIATVIDRGSNRLVGIPVTFTVKDGGGNFDGLLEVTVNTDSDGRATAVPTLGPDQGFDNNLVEANFANNPGFAASFTASGKTVGEPQDTKISGVVLDNSNTPIEGVTLHIEGTDLTTQSDAQGQFLLEPAPVGHVKLTADGSTAPLREGKPWPKLEYELVTIAGQNNTIGMPIYLLPIDTPRGLFVDETHGGTLTLDELPGFALTIIPGSATFPDGSKRGTVSVTLVHADKVPMVPNFGQQPRFIITIQPPGTHFNPPAPLTMPNVDGLTPGQKTEMYSFDHDLGSFVSIGPATVSEDGTVIQSDPGVGVIKGGWHCGGNPSTTESAGTCPDCQRPQGNQCVADPNENDTRCVIGNQIGLCNAGTCFRCPATVSVDQVIQLPLRNIFPQRYTGIGAVFAMKVGPTDTNLHWDDVIIREEAQPDLDASTCPGAIALAMCTENSNATFRVGDGGGTPGEQDTCQGNFLPYGNILPPFPDVFWDQHYFVEKCGVAPRSFLHQAGIAQCTVVCKQKYFCGPRTVSNFIITRTLRQSTLTDSQSNNMDVTFVSVIKN
ncbi:MAG: hypothetical protein HYZ50_03560 [Deltaproteobacteria bacterium]|nr:hypothetical protein [Deltaproteobacteria bacterium]